MTEWRDLFAEATESAPPSRLVADEVYAAGRQRRRRRAVVANAAVAVALAMAAGTGIAAMVRSEPTVRGESGTGGEKSLPGVLPYPGGLVQMVRAADARHLYVLVSTQSSCAKQPCDKSSMQLVGSDDGGRTWSDRGGPIRVIGFEVLKADRLLAVEPSGPSDTKEWELRTSTDGGRTWHTTERAPAVAAVSSGSTALCWPESGGVAGSPCIVHALDPTSRRIAPLTNQPPLTLSTELLIGESGGRLWASGVDQATGRPAVAVSRDAGRTWSTKVFVDAPACSSEGCQPPYLTTGDGPTAYAVVVRVRHRAVYRYVENAGRDGGDWQRDTGVDKVPVDHLVGGAQSFVAADGTHVLSQVVPYPDRDIEGYRWWVARPNGGTYQPVELPGLPATVFPIRRTPDGWFYAHSYPDGVLYGSTDGWRWSPVARSS